MDKILYFYAKKQFDIYIPKYEKPKNFLEPGKFIVGVFGQQYKVPQPRIINLKQNEKTS